MSNSNRLAAKIAVSASLAPAVAREMWVAGGCPVDEDATDIPITSAEVRGMSVDAAATAARMMLDPVELFKLFSSDKRVKVRSAAMLNPNMGPDAAAAAVEFQLDREQPVPLVTASNAGFDTVSRLFEPSPSPVKIAPDLESWLVWMGPDHLLSVADRPWAANLVAFCLVNGADIVELSEFTGDAFTSALWNNASNQARMGVGTHLVSRGEFSDMWLERFTGHGNVFASRRLCDKLGSGYGPLTVGNLDLFAGLFTDLETVHAPGVIRFMYLLEKKLGSNTDPAVPAAKFSSHVADVAAAYLGELSLIGAAQDPLLWLAGSVSETGAESLLPYMTAPSQSSWSPNPVASQLAHRLLSMTPLSAELRAHVLVAPKATSMLATWANGSFANNPATTAVAQMVLTAAGPANVAQPFAKNLHLWVNDPQMAATMLADPDAIACVCANPDTPQTVVDVIIALLAAEPAPAQHHSVLAAAADASTLDVERAILFQAYAKLLATHTVPEQYRCLFASRSANLRGFLAGAHPLNQVPLTGFNLDINRFEPDEVSALCTGVTNPIELRCAAAVNLLEDSSLTLASQIVPLGEGGPIPAELMARFAVRSSKFAGRWLAGSYVPNQLDTDGERVALTAIRELPTSQQLTVLTDMLAARPAHRPLSQQVLDWIADVPETLLVAATNCALAATLAAIATQHLGENPLSWRLFVELGDGSSASMREVLELVEASS